MASMAAKGSNPDSNQMSPAISVQAEGSRSKRKVRADPAISDSSKMVSSPQSGCMSYEFSAGNFEFIPKYRYHNRCNMCSVSQDHSDALKLGHGLSCAAGPSEVEHPSYPEEEIPATIELDNANWNDLTESQLEELVLNDLDTIFKSAIKKIVDFGYAEEVATKAILRSVSGLCYACKVNMSKVADNSLAFLRKGQNLDQLGEPSFHDLEQMKKYILAELVSVIREVRPFWGIGDAMWCLLICDMDANLACEMASDRFNRLALAQVKTERTSLENLSDTSLLLNGLVPEKKTPNPLDKSPTSVSEEKFGSNRKITGITRRDDILGHKPIEQEKTHHAYGSKGASREGKLGSFGGLILDKKSMPVADSRGITVRNATLKITKAVEVDLPRDNVQDDLSLSAINLETINDINTISASPKNNFETTIPTKINADTELSLLLPTENNRAPVPVSCNSEAPGVPQDKKDEVMTKLVPRVQGLENQLQEWTDWANQKVMQAARRLGKDKAEIKTLKEEREEVDRLKKEKQIFEENTMKNLFEVENSLRKADIEMEQANSNLCWLEIEYLRLTEELEAAKLGAAEAAARYQEQLKRVKQAQMKLESCNWEKEKTFYRDELVAQKRKNAQLRQEIEQAKNDLNQLEASQEEAEKENKEIDAEIASVIKRAEKSEVSAKLRNKTVIPKAEKSLHRVKDHIEKLERGLSQMRLKTNSSRIAALRRGVDGSYSSTSTDSQAAPDEDHSGGVTRERECVMCLSEEMSVVFLPCGHLVVCTACNELHEKKGMKECPSCRTHIVRRVSVRYALS